ncbi:hypothetical protein [Paenibacillus sp. 32352]|uniref:hypothetical protein n=1 Tax=Paenibacillus sp. 32352 TaxID=1969111 RepID=UPI0015C44929|nr:hypothetical protein [Paenibacillus sp. 32352]
MNTLHVADYAGKKIMATDGTQFLLITDGEKLTYMNFDVCRIYLLSFSGIE